MLSLTEITDDKTECLLCPHYCKLGVGKTGICGVRKNTGKNIELMTYGVLSGYALDPVEKKPLYHFFPGHKILSIGSFGCNLRCDFCQNFHISQKVPESLVTEKPIPRIIQDALSTEKNIGIAFTYNEPIISFEYMQDVALSAKKEGLYTVMISNGYVNSEPLNAILQFIDAFNIDLKAFNNSFYRLLTGADIEPVKNSLKQIAQSEKHLEITTLIIPGLNDDEKEMELQSKWIASELGKDVPFHLSRYFPTYKRDNPPTPENTLMRLFEIASSYLNYVYLGNSHLKYGQNTKCNNCGTEVTIRSGYNSELINLDQNGKCTCCGNLVYKNFTFS